MTSWELTLPLAQSQNLLNARQSQGESLKLAPRLCLLKGCERSFNPGHYLDRYCGEACKQAARRWRLARANERYRASENGKRNRRQQAIRYRGRLKERDFQTQQLPSDARQAQQVDPTPLREGYHKEDCQEKSSCDRPGCYKRFTPPPRSPLQTFCCPSCRKALRRVQLREQRWIRKLATRRYQARDGPTEGDP